jgi:hypothetical protein
MISTTRKNWFFCLARLGANQVFWRGLDPTEVDRTNNIKTKQNKNRQMSSGVAQKWLTPLREIPTGHV